MSVSGGSARIVASGSNAGLAASSDALGSTVLEWMVQMWRQAKSKGGTLATCNCSPIGKEVLHAARFDTLWQIFDSRQQAIEALG